MSLAVARKRRGEIMCPDDGLTTVSSNILEYSKYEGDKRKSSDQAARYLKNIKEAFGQRIISTITGAELVGEIRTCSAERAVPNVQCRTWRTYCSNYAQSVPSASSIRT